MEEVDSIILHFLRQLNINIGEENKSICELPVEIIIESASRCLSEINHNLKIPTKLPSGISHRIEVASQIASICKDLGYKNEVGYQTFLYSNEADLRQVFMFLIERLPNEGTQTSTRTASTNKKQLFLQEISNKINEELNTIWIPPCCNVNTQKSIGDSIACNNTSDQQIKKYGDIEVNEEHLMKSLFKIKEKYLNTETKCELRETDPDPSKEANVEDYEIHKSLKELQEEVIVLRQKLDTLESDRNVMDVEYSQVQKSCEKVETEMKNVQNILESIGINDIENTDSVNNVIEKVQNNICSLHKKSEELTSKNLSLKVDIDKINKSMTTSESERTKCKKVLLNLKEEAKAIKDEYQHNEEIRNQLKKSYEKCKGGNKRSIYTKRILEIISNVDKQNMEIKKILEDTRQLQKEINSLEGQLDRCFSIADETLFRDAKKDDQAKKAYKLLALLHSECSTIVSLVNDTGTIAREIVDLEDNIKTEKAKKAEDTLKKIHLDLTKMQQESVLT
ncbi:coiled-coil domain-containing protein 22 isoform X1 [Ostrinia nubilalis]|uniref:coiled-coil domain-containing protein 22 n=1 Tax=Ostrinia furnacalis TaxID=93504 RepID=UPI0010405E27|nr:coiled-coil domain-containing protein 22 [Ostrinia furnacalis]